MAETGRIARALALVGGLVLMPPLADAVSAQEIPDLSDPGVGRAFLVEQVEAHARAAAGLTGRETLSPAVLEAMNAVSRHEFVAPAAAPLAYFDLPLPAEHDLRESQPFIVALMTDLAALKPSDDVLVLGIGGGYQAAIASRLAGEIYCLDLDAAAAASSMARLDRLGFHNVETRVADPYFGWPDAARGFDAIIVRLAIDDVPPVLLRQLRPGGRLVAPVGRGDEGQQLTLFTKDAEGRVSRRAIMPVLFMRLPGGERI